MVSILFGAIGAMASMAAADAEARRVTGIAYELEVKDCLQGKGYSTAALGSTSVPPPPRFAGSDCTNPDMSSHPACQKWLKEVEAWKQDQRATEQAIPSVERQTQERSKREHAAPTWSQTDDPMPQAPEVGMGNECTDPGFADHPRCAEWLKAMEAWKQRQKAKRKATATIGAKVPVKAPAFQPVILANYGVQFGTYESLPLAQKGWENIWGKHWRLLSDVQPEIRPSQLADGQVRYYLYGKGISKERAEGLCRNISQRGDPCLVVRF